MNKILLFGTVIFSILAFSGYKAFAQLREENKQPAAAAPKILIAYYSYSSNTKEVAEAIHEKIGGDIFEIKTEGSYPEAYRPMTQQAKKEIQNGYRPKLTTSIADISQYDIVFLGSPNWWEPSRRRSAASSPHITFPAKRLSRLLPTAAAVFKTQ